jgi:hypothetical protein
VSWQDSAISPCGTHHVDGRGEALYGARFDEVLAFHAPGLAPVRVGERAWHVRPDGSPAYDRTFLRTFGFYEGRAAVVTEAGWAHIDAGGRDAYPARHAWCGNFQGGRCTVRDVDGTYGHIDEEGRFAYAARYRYAGDYRGGIAVVQAADGLSTHIDRTGALAHGRWFVDLDVFHKGHARARDEDGWTHVDIFGAPAYSRRFAAVEPFYNGQARVERFDGALEVIDASGATIVELRPARRSELAALSGDLVGFWRTEAIATAVRLGVIEALPATEDEVAARCALRPEGARRILRALGELRLAERSDGRWHPTNRGEMLRAVHPLSLATAALEYADRFVAKWKQLPDALSTASTWTPPDVFGEVARDDARRDGHHAMLRSYARHDYARVPAALGLRGDEHVVDAGGGLGVLATAIVEAYPGVRVTVLERPEMVEQALTTPREGGAVEFRSADIFSDWSIQADAVLLARVLHDWDDERALQVLERARAALHPGGRVFIIEMVLPPDGFAGALCDLHLLMATGGRERTRSDFEHLLERAGFEPGGVRTIAALPSIVVGVAR